MKTILWISLFCFVLVSVPVHAKIYKWVDEKGKVHFTDDPTKIPKNKGRKIDTFRELPPTVPKKSAGERTRIPGALQNELGNTSKSGSQGGSNESLPQLDENQIQDIQKQLESFQETFKESQKAREQQLKALDEIEGSQNKSGSSNSRYPKY
jgi:hypothetical protein